MTRTVSDPQFILLFIYVIFVAHTLAELPEVVKHEFTAWRPGNPETILSARTNQSLQSLNVTGFQKPEAPPLGNRVNFDWAGAIQNTPPSGSFNAVEAAWFIPDITLPSITVPGLYGASVWVGIDGSTQSSCPGAVLRAGTITYLIVEKNGRIIKGAEAWYEWIPGPRTYLEPFEEPLSIGDPVSIYIGASSPSQATAVFLNTDTNDTTSRQVSSPSSPDYDICGESAEWILQRPANSVLGRFAPFDVEGCQAFTTTNDTANLDGSMLLFMEALNRVIAFPILSSSDVLTFRYIG